MIRNRRFVDYVKQQMVKEYGIDLDNNEQDFQEMFNNSKHQNGRKTQRSPLNKFVDEARAEANISSHLT